MNVWSSQGDGWAWGVILFELTLVPLGALLQGGGSYTFFLLQAWIGSDRGERLNLKAGEQLAQILQSWERQRQKN